MDTNQRNRLRMYKATREYLATHATVWSAVPAIQTAFDELGAKITVIDQNVTAQEAALSGYTQGKAQLRSVLESRILLLANATAAYARATGNEVLLADVQVTPSGLSALSEQRIDDAAERVKAAAISVLPPLAAYGVTAIEIAQLENALTDFEEARSTPDVKRAERAGITNTLDAKFADVTELLKGQLDLLLARYKATDPEFHAGYVAARVIIDLRGPGEDEEPDGPVVDPVPGPAPTP